MRLAHRGRQPGEEQAAWREHSPHLAYHCQPMVGVAHEVQHEQREQAGAAELADERVLRARSARAGGGLGRLERRGLGDGAIRAARGHRPKHRASRGERAAPEHGRRAARGRAGAGTLAARTRRR